MGLMRQEQGRHLPSPFHFLLECHDRCDFFFLHVSSVSGFLCSHISRHRLEMAFAIQSCVEIPNPILEWLLIQRLE